MPSRTERFRGGRTHGRGKKAGRGAGMRGGRGNAGLHKHKYTYTLKYMRDHFGRHGFKRPPSIGKADITMNVSELAQHRDELIANGLATMKGGVIELDLSALGINKLLGTGRVNTKYHITVEKASQKAVEKIESAGGKVIIKEI